MSQRPDYSEIEHTADVGFELSAPDLHSALERSAAAMFDIICGLESVEERLEIPVEVAWREGDLENLLVRWLTELLYLHEVRHLLLSRFRVIHSEGGRLEASASGEEFDPERHTIATELKAPTYHDLKLSEDDGRWSVRVIFDT